MIRRLKGTVIETSYLWVVVDVGGVGYLVYVPGIDSISQESEVELYTHLAVRENAMDLYGFLDPEELSMFELLLTLPKVGPKSAMQIMSQADVALLRKAALGDDASYLMKMSGIGKKTAEKIVVGLKDKLGGDDMPLKEGERGDGDVVDALITLGYTQKEARDAMQKLSPDLNDTNTRIKEALKLLGK